MKGTSRDTTGPWHAGAPFPPVKNLLSGLQSHVGLCQGSFVCVGLIPWWSVTATAEPGEGELPQ